ncbi:PaaI family thioesterase [Crocinitomicaceae bacterium]|jgi:1,4-dihydroxy-2-naphthoyl-CoA hydrolase|nr:PaaI family thioesterase [Crocinitomicaceae bacterium]
MKKLKKVPLDLINSMNKNTLMEQLGIECIELGDDYVISRMPVDKRTHQPMGLLHGGASAALIESIGSMGSTLLLDISKQHPVGIEVNANHIGGIRSGHVIAKGKIVHAGKKTHLWQVDITEEDTNKLVCSGRLTVMIIDI